MKITELISESATPGYYTIGDSHAHMVGIVGGRDWVNLAIGGTSSTDSKMLGNISKIPAGSIVLVSQGANDTANALLAHVKHKRKLKDPEQIAANVARVVSMVQAQGATAIFLLFPNGPKRGPEFWYSGPYQDKVRAAIRSAISVPIIDLNGKPLYDGIHAYNGTYKEVANQVRSKYNPGTNLKTKATNFVQGLGHKIGFKEDQTDEIHDYGKLDDILSKLCDLIDKGQQVDSEKYGMVAAAVLDSNNNLVSGLNMPASNGQRRHAERVAIDNYNKKYGDIPEGSIIITTCSPCSEHMDERYGEDCTELINNVGVKKVYAGFMDPTQKGQHREFNIMETANADIRQRCEEFANTFLNNIDENFADGRNPQDKGDSKRYNVPTKGSISSLRKIAKQGGRRGQLAHWMANMKSGRKK